MFMESKQYHCLQCQNRACKLKMATHKSLTIIVQGDTQPASVLKLLLFSTDGGCKVSSSVQLTHKNYEISSIAWAYHTELYSPFIPNIYDMKICASGGHDILRLQAENNIGGAVSIFYNNILQTKLSTMEWLYNIYLKRKKTKRLTLNWKSHDYCVF